MPDRERPLAGERPPKPLTRCYDRRRQALRRPLEPGGPARVPVVAVGDDQDRVLAFLAATERHPPVMRGEADRAGDLSVEGDPLPEAEAVGILVEVPGHQAV